jgi:maltose alpha-D-glucosyltransferase / alpha-amylase
MEVARTVATNSELKMDGGTLRFEATDQLRTLVGRSLQPVEHFGGEQTRTRVILGESIFLKAYRRLIPGTNPDLEMTRHLTDAGFRYVAALVGAVRWESPEDESTLLTALFQFVRNQGHAWGYALDHLERFATGLVSEPVAREQDPHALINAQMRTLGRRVGELHAALARDSADPAFAPEPVTDADLSAWYAGIAALANELLEDLKDRLPNLPDAVQGKAREAIAMRDRLLETVRQSCVRIPGLLKTRVHGNLHLKKILLVADDFLITDFDGDMNRQPSERRTKTSALHDVATLLRSFDYARATTLDRAVSVRPDLHDRASVAFDEWRHGVSEAFLRGYRLGLGDAHGGVGADATERLLRLFQIERALYELGDELKNRPSWVGVPLDALRALLA